MSTSTEKRKKRLRKECFKLLGEISFKREPNCVICGKRATDPHHFIKRSLCKHLQLDLDNIVSLCRGCHSRLEWTGDPEMNAKIEARRPKGWAEGLYKKRRQVKSGMWTLAYLEEKKKELDATMNVPLVPV